MVRLRPEVSFKYPMIFDRPNIIEMAIRDLDDYLTLFPDRLQAREMRDALRASKAERLSVLV